MRHADAHIHTFATRFRIPVSSNNILCCEWAKEKVVQTLAKRIRLLLIVSFPKCAAAGCQRRHRVYPLEKRDFQQMWFQSLEFSSIADAAIYFLTNFTPSFLFISTTDSWKMNLARGWTRRNSVYDSDSSVTYVIYIVFQCIHYLLYYLLFRFSSTKKYSAKD